jgi:NADPH:quinone reductase-like Zn-dependent oxidoreductase
MNATYRAIELSGPGKFSEVRKPLLDPGPNQVRIRVEACGVCHSDSVTVDGLFPIDWPRVPGHEVVGRIDALGSGVQGWAVGQRAWGSGFSGVLVAIASTAAMAFGRPTTSSTVRIYSRAAKGCSIWSRRFRQRSSTSLGRLWPT